MNVNTEPNNVLSFAELRRRAELTLSDLAKVAGYAQASSVHQIERGKYPRLDRAQGLARALNVTLEQLHAAITESIDQAQRRTRPAETEAPEPE